MEEPAIRSVRTARSLVLKYLARTITCLHPQAQAYLAAQPPFLEAEHSRYLALPLTPIKGAPSSAAAAAQVGLAYSEVISQSLQEAVLGKPNIQCLLLSTSHPNRSEGTPLEVAYLVV